MALPPRNTIPAELTAFLSYDPASGDLTWTNPRHRRGKTAGRPRAGRYIVVKFKGTEYAAHRVAWFLATGMQPPELLDHADCDKHNNRLENLRATTPMLNNANWRPQSPYGKGVTLHSCGKYQAQIKAGGRNFYLGLFETVAEANAAYAQKAAELFGEFARAA